MQASKRWLWRGGVTVSCAAVLAACGTATGSTPYGPAGNLTAPGSANVSGAAALSQNPGAAFAANTYMAKIVQRGRLVGGVRQDTLLFGYLNPRTYQFEGFEVDVLREIARALFNGDTSVGRVELRPVTSAQRIPALQDGALDIVAATMTITDDRRRQIDFSDVYYAAGQRLLVKKDSAVTGIKDLDKKDKTVCAARDSTSEQNVAKVAPNAQRLLLDGYPDCLVALQQGRADAVSSDDALLAGLAEQDPNTKLVGDTFADAPYALGIAKSSTGFVEFVNGVLRQMKQNGRWKALYQQWLGKVGPVPEPPA